MAPFAGGCLTLRATLRSCKGTETGVMGNSWGIGLVRIVFNLMYSRAWIIEVDGTY